MLQIAGLNSPTKYLNLLCNLKNPDSELIIYCETDQ
jgi:hypothetical protein